MVNSFIKQPWTDIAAFSEININAFIGEVLLDKKLCGKPGCKHLFIFTVVVILLKILFNKCGCKVTSTGILDDGQAF